MKQHPHIEKGATIAHGVLITLFRFAMACVFVPIAWAEFSKGNSEGAILALLLGCCLPAIVAPHNSE